MANFRYPAEGTWFKGNTHIHSTASDGGKNFTELANLYAGAGYDFLFRTDHWVASSVVGDKQDYPLLWLDGIELDGVDATGAAYHVVALGSFEGLERSIGLQAGIDLARQQNGILILAHPHWTGNTFEDALRWDFDGVEVYNHVCRWLNGKGDGSAYWSAMLERNANTLAFAVDDGHLNETSPGWNGGWIMVNATERAPEAILQAIRNGNFYASCGPRFESLQLEDDNIWFRSSAVQFARLVGPGSHGYRTGNFDGSLLTEGSFRIPSYWPYATLEIEDAQGRRAWTNMLSMMD